MDSKNNSPWEYFTRTKDEGKCKISGCGKKIKASGGSTSGLHTHLRTIHNINLLKGKRVEKSEKDPDDPKCVKVSTSSSKVVVESKEKIVGFFKPIIKIDKTIPAIISRLVARDGLPFLKICTSYDIREMLKRQGDSNIPKSSNTVRKIVLDYGKNIREELSSEFSKLKTDQEKFSVTLDEWTSKKVRRYMNVNVHTDNNFFNLGLSRVWGKMPAEKCIEVFNERIGIFGLSLNDIVAVTTDGASVMIKFGKLLGIIHQICLAHGLHLAVIKCLYGKTPKAGTNEDEEGDEEDDEVFCDEELDQEGLNLEVIEEDICVDEILNIDVKNLIIKIRKIIKKFRKSVTKNEEFLQKEVKEKFGKEKVLLLDVKTRWNSLLDALERFYELQECIRLAFRKLKIEFDFSETEMKLLQQIITALQPVKIASETLGLKQANLLTADVTLRFMLDELSKQNSPISEDLLEELKFRIRERRNEVTDVLQYLHDPEGYSKLEEDYGIFNGTSKAAITKKIIEIGERLCFKENVQDLSEKQASGNGSTEILEITDSVNVDEDNKDSEKTSFWTLKEKLHSQIKATMNKSDEIEQEPGNLSELSKVLKKELVVFSREKKRGKYLKLIYKYLLTIKPTSVESERAFSSAGSVCTNLRTNLSDISLDIICFLKAYFLKNKDLYI